MPDLDKMKKELQISRANTAKMELEYKICEKKDEIKRIEDHIKLQDELIEKLSEELG